MITDDSVWSPYNQIFFKNLWTKLKKSDMTLYDNYLFKYKIFIKNNKRREADDNQV